MRLLRAEMLKLVRRRGLMAWAALLTVGVVLIAEIVIVTLHAVNPAHHGPAGGSDNLEHTMFLVAGLGDVAAILIGATAGSQDVGNGVFRDLVVTGRSRATLFRIRAPGAFLVFLPLLALGLAIAIGSAYAFAGSLPEPSAGRTAHWIVYALLVTGINLVLAVSIASFASSRVVVGVLISWNAIVAPILISLSILGSARKLIDVAAAVHFAPSHDSNTVPMSWVTALVVLVVWAAVFISAGTWFTRRRDA